MPMNAHKQPVAAGGTHTDTTKQKKADILCSFIYEK